MSKINANSTFMGRKSEINNISNYFASNDFSIKKIYSLYGESGIGKSFICEHLYTDDLFLPKYLKFLIDFNYQANRCMINVIDAILCTFSNGELEKTNDLLKKYYTSIDSSKPVFFNELLGSFISEINVVASSTPILVILDTLEVVYGSLEWDNIKRIIFETSQRVCFLCSGIDVLDSYSNTIEREVLGFSSPEIAEYFSKRVPKLRKELKNPRSFLPEKIQRFTKNGHPVLCGLLADWLIESPTQMSYVLDNSREISEKLIISEWVKEATTNATQSTLLKKALQLMSYFTMRMDAYILKELLEIDADTSKDIIEHIGKYSFVKYLQEDCSIILHDIVADLITRHHPIQDIDLYYRKLMVIYNNLVSEAGTNIFSISSSYLRLERVYYHIIFENRSNAIDLFEREFLLCLDGFDYSTCNVLLMLIKDDGKLFSDSEWYFTYQLAQADLLLSKFKPSDAISIYNNLLTSERYSSPLFKAKADEIYARSIMNPCTLPQLDINGAISILDQCIQIYINENLTYRLTRSWFCLGMAFVRIGRSLEAQKAYDEAQKYCTSSFQRISILLELSKMLRLQQFVENSLTPLTKCGNLIESLRVNKGKYYYYFGNTMRDLNEFELAEENYEKALQELSAGIDDFILAELYLDYSWMEYLRSEHVNFDKVYRLLEQGWELADKHGFGTEFSEYYHIKYEIERDQNDLIHAFEDLEIALGYAKEYSNIYMILDCLNHRAQQLYMQNNYAGISDIIAQMADVERTGCGIRVFRGRAKLVQADVYYKQHEYKKAFEEWKEGFCIVALYGNSRSNVELFSDLFHRPTFNDNISRRDKMRQIIENTKSPTKKQLRRYWVDNRVTEQFDYFISELYE